MKAILKATHAAFIAALDRELLAIGATKYLYAKTEVFRPEVPGYRFETRHGTLELHPAMPWEPSGRRKVYDITVFGRFPDAERAKQSFAQWKWNHHFGYRSPDEVEMCAAEVARGVSLMLPAVANEPQPGTGHCSACHHLPITTL